MTLEQIKAIVKQAGGEATGLGCNTYVLTQDEIAEFVRLVREDSFNEAASFVTKTDLQGLRHDAYLLNYSAQMLTAIAEFIRSLK